MLTPLPLKDLMPLISSIAFPTRNPDGTITPGMPVGIIGKPGSGKTSFIETIARTKGYRLEVLPLATWTAESINGIPAKEIRKIPNRNGILVDFALCVDVAPDWQFRIFSETDPATGKRRPTLLFLDEASNVETAVMATLLTLVQSRRLPNNMRLPDDTVIILAMNSQEDSVNGFPMPAPMANRVAWFAWEVSPTTWVEGFRRNWGHPTTEKETWWRTIIGDYITDNPSELEAPSDGGVTTAVGRSKNEIQEATAYAWRSGRSWDNLTRQLTKFDPNDVATIGRVATAIIGVTGAQRFIGYYRDRASTITVKDLLRNPGCVKPYLGDVNLLTRLADGVAATIIAEHDSEAAEATIRLYETVGADPELAALRVQLGSRITSVVDALHQVPSGAQWVGRLMPVLKQHYSSVLAGMN